MSQFRVLTASVQEVSGRLGGIAPEVSTHHAAAAGHARAATGTPAAAAVEGLMGRWAQVLPLYAQSAARLSAAVQGAAVSYGAADRAVGDGCTPGTGGA